MATTAKWTAYSTYSNANLADNTALASRADGYFNICQVAAADVVIDNSANLHLYMDIEIKLGSATWTTTGFLAFYLLAAIDAATPTYPSGSSTYLPTSAFLAASLNISTDTSAAARNLAVRGIVIPPTKFKMLWYWKAGVTSAAASNSMSFVTYTEQAV